MEERGACPYLNNVKDDETNAVTPTCMCPGGCCGFPWDCPAKDKEVEQ